MEMEYGKAFSYPQQETDWVKKWLIAGAVSLVPLVGNLLVSGYTLEVTRRVIAGEQQVLPEWTDFGELFKKGIYGFVVGFVYVLPLIIILACSAVPQAALTAADSGDGTLATIGSVVAACFGCLAAIYGLLVALTLPAAFGKLASTGEIGPALRVGEVFALVRSKPAVYVIVMLLAGLAVSVLASLGSIVCGIGAAFGAAYGLLVSAHLHGQAYRVASTETGMTPASA